MLTDIIFFLEEFSNQILDPRVRELCQWLLLAERKFYSSQYQEFQKFGVVHLVVLSGLHAQVLYLTNKNILSFLLRSLTRFPSEVFIHLLSLTLLGIYLSCLSFPAPLTRAFICLFLTKFLNARSTVFLGFAFHGLIFPQHLNTASFLLSWIFYLYWKITATIMLQGSKGADSSGYGQHFAGIVALLLATTLLPVFSFENGLLHFCRHFFSAITANLILGFHLCVLILPVLTMVVLLSFVHLFHSGIADALRVPLLKVLEFNLDLFLWNLRLLHWGLN